MKSAYPVIFLKTESGYVAHVPDFDIDTQGATLAEAIEMSRDAIGIMGIDLQDDYKTIPQPSSIETIECEDDEIVSMVDIDFTAYRKANDRKTVRRTVSLPSWLDDAATRSGINVSAVLRTALEKELDLEKAI